MRPRKENVRPVLALFAMLVILLSIAVSVDGPIKELYQRVLNDVGI